MGPMARRLGVAAIAAIFLLVGGVKLWATDAAVGAAGALFGCGLLTAGISVREWVTPDRPRPKEGEQP